MLAVLVMASLWPERYPGGWVSVDEFGRAGLYLGERRNRESLKAAIRRGVARLRTEPLGVRVETRRTLDSDPVSGCPRRERDRRIACRAFAEGRSWLESSGVDLIVPSLARCVITRPVPPGLDPTAMNVSAITALGWADWAALLALVKNARQPRLARLYQWLQAELKSSRTQ